MIRRLVLGLSAVVFAFVFALLAMSPAQAAPPEIVSAQIEPFVSTVGDRLTLTIVIDHDAGTTITGPDENGDFGGAELIEIADPTTEPIANSERERTTLQYTLAAFETGPAEVPRLELSWRSETELGALRTLEVPYTVDSVVAPSDNTLRPLKAQLELPQPAPPPYVPATFVMMMAGLTVFGYWLIRRTIAVPPVPLRPAIPPPAPPTSAEIARSSLNKLSTSGLAQSDPAEYYTRLAAITRGYLSAQFDFAAYAMTRREMEREMRRRGIDRWPARLTANLLEQCDAVEFAQFRPATERRSHDLDAAYEIIQLTEDAPVPVEPASGPAEA